MITTPRLSLIPLNVSQLERCLTDLPALEAELEFPIAREVINENVTRAIGMKIVKMETLPLAKHYWQTYWLIVVPASDDRDHRIGQSNKVGAGLIGFKGYLNTAGETEIGYGIAPQFQGHGYMTEAVRALCAWAFEDPACRAITATTVVNPASNRVLEKVRAQLVSVENDHSNWKIYRPEA